MKSLNKLTKLKQKLRKSRNVVIAFSGGVDSSFLAKVAIDLMGNQNVLLVTATSTTFPKYELEDAEAMAKYLNARHLIIHSEELDIPGFAENPPDRCFHCKSQLFGKIRELATENGFEAIFDGSNVDDMSDYRPGRRALEQFLVQSPLREAGFTKNEIRQLSRNFKLPTADKQSYACLASRFPYGERISKKKLDRVSQAEWKMRDLGFQQFRVRSHQDLARVEVSIEEMEIAWSNRNEILQACLKAGFKFACLDLEGYQSGKMNRALSLETIGQKSTPSALPRDRTDAVRTLESNR